MDMHITPYFFDINKCIVSISSFTSITNFSAIVLIFGSDFYPGIQNIPMTSSAVSDLLKQPQFAYRFKDYVMIDKPKFNKAIHVLSNYCNATKFESDSSSTSESCSDKENIILVGYSNITPKNLDMIVKSDNALDCNNNCLVCQPANYVSKRTLRVSAAEYMTMYTWTLNYFSGCLSKNKSINSQTTYTSYTSPSLYSVVSTVPIPYSEVSSWAIDIVLSDDYNLIIENGLNLNYKVIPNCNKKNTYGEINILTKELTHLSCLRKNL